MKKQGRVRQFFIALRRVVRRKPPAQTAKQVPKEPDLDAALRDKNPDELASLASSFHSITNTLKEQLRARDQLLLDISHELRGPLTRMRVALEMAAPGTAMDTLHEEIDSLDKMVAEILETERLNSPAGQLNRETLEIGALISETISQFKGRPPGIQKKWVDPVVLKLDGERMRLVLRNILDNALKYGAEAAKPVEVTLRREGGFAILVVRDFGPGIPENELRLVFEPFYRVGRSRSSSASYGLGLPLCKRIVDAHGGRMLLASGVGEGTRVTVELPLK